jgi:nitrate reductase gamma subunit
VPFHYGIITILTGHAIAFLVPGSVLAWNSKPIRLYVLEVMLLTCGILTVVGLFNLIVRRAGNPMTRATSSPTDWILLAFLAGQVAIGIYIAVFKGWGSSWFAAAASPYLWSLAKLKPDVTYISGLPWIVKTHILNSFIIIALFPFTRLVHILVVPNPYLWRKQQMVRWYWDRKHIR